MKESTPVDMTKVLSDLSRQNRHFGARMVAFRTGEWMGREYPSHASQYMGEIRYHDGYLSIRISSDSWRHQLSMQRDEIKNALIAFLGGYPIQQLFFL